LRQYAVELSALNDAVLATESVLTAARQKCNEVLYTPKTGMTDTALAVKEYVKAAFGAGSPQFREVKCISFKTRKP
jgi:hypothetical protein